MVGLIEALGHCAMIKEYVGSKPHSFMAIALFAMIALLVSDTKGGRPPKLPEILPGNQSGSSVVFLMSWPTASGVGASAQDRVRAHALRSISPFRMSSLRLSRPKLR